MHKLMIAQQNNALVLDGELTRRTVTKSFEKKSRRMLKGVDFIDLSSVSRSDTAGLAWLLVMIESAHIQALSIKISNIPQELLKLAKLSAVDSFLPVE